MLTAAIVGVGAAAVARDPEDKVTLTSNTALHDVTLILIGRRSDNECSLDVVKAGPSTWWEVAGSGELPVIGVFAPEHVAILRNNPPWSDGQGDEVDLTLAARVVVPVKVWVAVSKPGSVALAQSDLTEAENLFEKNHAGITFQPDITQVTGSDVATIGFGCDNAVSLVSSSPPLYDPNRLNVYYVEQIVNFLGIPFRGFYCLDARGIRNIIYVSTTLHSSTTLTHELGHAFVGLGHTGGSGVPRIPGFTSKNLMWSSATVKGSESRNTFSLGQVYRINADAGSWLNQVVGGGSATALRPSGFTRPCQTTPAVCPPLALKWTPSFP